MTTHWILGPGAIGRLLAHSLAPFCEVVVIGRRALPTQQTLTTPEGEQKVQRLNTVTVAGLATQAPSPPDFVHITTKAMTAEAALESLTKSLPSRLSPTTPLVLWQNGFLAQPRITEAWAGPVLCATTTQGAYLTGDDGVVHAGRGPTFVGDLYHQHGALAQTLALALTQAGLEATAVSDIRQRLWQKLAVNAAINPLVALKGVRNGELRDETYAGHVGAVVKDVAAILHAEGIQPPNGGHGEAAWLDLVWQVVDNTANNKASMLQDVEAKRPTEREAILGPLMESARHHGLPCEVLSRLDAELAELEAAF
ncbi:ketopantoate reductase family protein [Halomonas sp. LS-001]